MTDRLQQFHPRRAAIGRCLASAIPMPDDAEAKDERRLCRHIDHRQAMR